MEPTVNIVPGENLPIERVYHTSVDVDPKNRLKYVAFMGAKNTVYYEYPASSLSSSQAIFTIQLPSVNTVLDRRVYARFVYTVTFNVTTGSGGMYLDGSTTAIDVATWCLRQYPITACTSTVSVDLNSSRFSYNPDSTCHALSYFGQNELFARTYKSQAAGMRDLVQSVAYEQTSLRIPAQQYGENVTEETRNILNYCNSVTYLPNDASGYSGLVYPDSQDVIVGSNTSTSISFTFQTTEPIMVSPFIAGSADLPGLSQINNMQIAYTFSSLNRVIAGVPDTATTGHITSMNVTLNSATLLARLYTLHMDYPVPQQNYWSVYDIQRYIQTSQGNVTAASATSNNVFSVTSQIINFSSHPKYIFLYCKPSTYVEQDPTGVTLFDTFARILNVNIIYCNKLCLQSASEEELYNLSVRNGYTSQWSMWKAWTGSVLCINPSTDLSLDEGECSGVGNGQYSFQATVQAVRPVSQLGTTAIFGSAAITAFTYDLNVVAVTEGFLTCNRGGIMTTIVGPLRKEQVLAAPINHGEFQHLNSVYKLFGSGTSDSLNTIAQKANSMLSKMTPVAEALAKQIVHEKHETGGRMLSRGGLHRRLQRLR